MMNRLKLLLIFLILILYKNIYAEIIYKFKYNLIENTPGFDVTLEFTGNIAGQSFLQLPNKWAGNQDLYKIIKNLHIINGIIKPTEKNHVKHLQYVPSSKVTIKYRIEESNNQYEFSVYGSEINSEYFYWLGPMVMPIVLNSSDVNQKNDFVLEWEIPNDWTIINSFSKNTGTSSNLVINKFSANNLDFYKGLFVGGKISIKEYNTDTGIVAIALIDKWDLNQDKLNKNILDIISLERKFWPSYKSPFFLIAIRPIEEDIDTLGGMGLTNAFSLTIPDSTQLETKLNGLMAHEYFHTWNKPGVFNDPKNATTYYWFTEGFTDYYTNLFLLRLKLISLEEYIELFNDVLSNYYTSPVRNIKNSEIKEAFWRDFNAQKLPYQRGMILAHNWNAILRYKSVNKVSLDHLMQKWLWENNVLNYNIMKNNFLEKLPEYNIEKDFSDIQEGNLIVPKFNILGPCVRMAYRTMHRYELGFDPRLSIVTGKIQNLLPDSELYAQGLREDDKLLSLKKEKNSDSSTYFALKAELGSGEIKIFNINPNRGQDFVVPQFVLDSYLYNNNPDFCLKWFK